MIILNKEEAKVVMKQKEFENFLTKTSRIIERALNTEIDVVGSFFEND
jgi:hypothetical protein